MKTSISNNSEFNDFLQHEYNNIAQAHFKTTEMISEYIKHYLTVISIPITIIVVIFNLDAFKQMMNYQGLPNIVIASIGVLFLLISLIGLMFYWYILNLRWDAILYARTVNGIRKYNYDYNNSLPIEILSKYRVLPQSPIKPGYKEFNFFGPVVFTFLILNSFYSFIGGLAYLFGTSNFSSSNYLFLSIYIALFSYFHIFIYLKFAERRESHYLRSNIIGVDIDGVLNEHRIQFAEYLKKNRDIELDPKMIVSIPVRDIPGTNITKQDEISVFNDPEYWTTMPVAQDASDVLRSLHNSMKIKVHIFTNRPWPLFLDKKGEKPNEIINNWNKKSKEFWLDVYKGKSIFKKLKAKFWVLFNLFPYRIRRVKNFLKRETHVERITIAWLEKNNFIYDHLMVEFGSEDVADPSVHVYNRFYAARTQQIRFFVEDDLVKAEKLSFICDTVFLIDHPYNQSDTLPSNIIRVHGWNELLKKVRKIW